MKTQFKAIKLLPALMALSSVALGLSVQASQNYELPGGRFDLHVGSVPTSIPLDGFYYIQNVFIVAESDGFRTADVEIFAGGQLKGTLPVTRKVRSNLVSIGETVASIEIRVVRGPSVKVHGVYVNRLQQRPLFTIPSDSMTRFHQGNLFVIGGGEGIDLAQKAILAVDILMPFSAYQDAHMYLRPIRERAGRCQAMSVNGILPFGKCMVLLAASIVNAESYIQRYFQIPNLFIPVVNLLAVKNQIARYLGIPVENVDPTLGQPTGLPGFGNP